MAQLKGKVSRKKLPQKDMAVNFEEYQEKYGNILDRLGFFITNEIQGVKEGKFPIFAQSFKERFIDTLTHEFSHYAILPRKLLKVKLNYLLSGKRDFFDYFHVNISAWDKFHYPKENGKAIDFHECTDISAKGDFRSCPVTLLYGFDRDSTRYELGFPFILTMDDSGVCAFDYELRNLFQNTYGKWKDFSLSTGYPSFRQLWIFGAKPSLNLFEPTIHYIYNFSTNSIDCFYNQKRVSSLRILKGGWLRNMKTIFLEWVYPLLTKIFKDKFISEYPNIETWLQPFS